MDRQTAEPASKRASERAARPRGDGSRPAASAEHQASRAVTQSNVEASIERDLDPQDPRWLVALETAAQLEGSLLTFERRRKVLAFAQRVGVRPFDANLIIAAIQDRARRGEGLEEAMSTVALTSAPGHPPLRRAIGRGERPSRRWWRLARPQLLSREAMPYILTGLVAVLAHAAAIGVVVWLMLA